ncbi:MAG TPA: hypothetical protein VKQ32_29935 [Polyangia bacterium]|nr:hypothetical protein [Polyangia bacterium]
MNNLRLGCLVALFASACAADPDPITADGLPLPAARALEQAPGANYVATLIPGQMRPYPDTLTGTDGTLAAMVWKGFAMLLDLDPVEDAATVAISAYVGPCGLNEAVVVVAPSGDPEVFAARVDAAIEAWRTQHPPPPADEGAEPPDPALSGWVPVPGGTCTVLQRSDFEPLAITVTHAGFLQLNAALSGNPCHPEVGSDSGPDFAGPPEALDATRLAGRALAKTWQQFAGAAPAVIEAMPEGAQLTWMGDAARTVQLDFDPVRMTLSPASAAESGLPSP